MSPKPLPWSSLSPRLRALWQLLRTRAGETAEQLHPATKAEPLGYSCAPALSYGLQMLESFGWATAERTCSDGQPVVRWFVAIPPGERAA